MDTLGAVVRADLTRHYGRCSAARLVRAVLLERTFRVVLTLRLCQAVAAGRARPLLPLAVVAHRIASGSAAVDLPWRTRIGPGFRLFHGWGAVVNTGAVIGADVSLFTARRPGSPDATATPSTSTSALTWTTPGG